MGKNTQPKILINCSNLHVGGGVAVATSFIDSLSRLPPFKVDVFLLLSSEVNHNLHLLGTNLQRFNSCVVKDFFGLGALIGFRKSFSQKFDLVFTVFGPAYALFSSGYQLVGFAQPNIIYPRNPISKRLNYFSYLSQRVKYKLQEYFFSAADSIIVELEHVELGLRKLKSFERTPIHLVNSSVHSIYSEPHKWTPITLPPTNALLKLGIISRNYAHKNIAILSDVRRQLRLNHGLNVDFYVTFRPDEWSACKQEFKDQVINVGGLALSQCPSFYSAMDGVIFPSLLECFSAVPIEAMMAKKPLFASDLPFIHDVCAEYCNYFDPFDADSIAKSISNYFNQTAKMQKETILAAHEHVKKYPGSDARAQSYMSIIYDALSI